MPIPEILCFTPVPLRLRRDGWSPELQLRFVVALAQGTKPGDAARAVGKNRQNAYALRKRAGAESFSAAWDAAVAFACRARKSTGRQEARRRWSALPRGDAAAAIARQGLDAVVKAVPHSLEAASRALGDMLDALYGPKSDKGDTNGAERSDHGKPNFPNLSDRTVAFRPGRLRRAPW